MGYEKILYDVSEGVATVTLNFPEKRNAMRAPMIQELGQALAAAEADEAVQAVVLTGAGGHFSAGGDMGAAGAPPTLEGGLQRMQRGSQTVNRLLQLRKPLVAAVDGVCYGAGFSFAIGADLLIASDRARFCMAFMRMGLVPDGAALFTLPRLVGLQRARELIYTTRELDAATAREWGLVLEVVSADDLPACARAVAQAMGSHSPVAFAATKAALLRSSASDLGPMIDTEIQAQGLAFLSAYASEVGQRFVAKQAPLFQWPAAPSAKT